MTKLDMQQKLMRLEAQIAQFENFNPKTHMIVLKTHFKSLERWLVKIDKLSNPIIPPIDKSKSLFDRFLDLLDEHPQGITRKDIQKTLDIGHDTFYSILKSNQDLVQVSGKKPKLYKLDI